MPEKSGTYMIIFAVIFGLVAAFKTYASRRELSYAKWIPSGIAFAIGFLNTPSFSLARLIGGVTEYLYYRRMGGKEKGGIRLIIIASGFVLGEGVVSILSLIFRTWGVGVVSCAGCIPGLCGGCPA